MKYRFCGIFVAAILWGTLGAPTQAQTFREVTDVFEPNNLFYQTTVGAAAVDINNDGLVDLYRFGSFFLQQPDGRFVESREAMGLLEEGNVVFGAIFGDYRFGRVFFYHNGAESYYAARGFRCVVGV